MSQLLFGYPRCSTYQQDLTAQRDVPTKFAIKPKRIYVDHGVPGTNRNRSVLREAIADCRAGATLVVAKLDAWARSVHGPDLIRSPTRGGKKVAKAKGRQNSSPSAAPSSTG